MKAITINSTGTPAVLNFQDIAEPVINQGTEVKIQLHAAGINPVDTKVRNNGLFYPDPYPAILGCDGAGEIIAIGEQVSNFQIGDPVWFCNGGLGKDQGNYAQYTVVDQRWLAKKPEQLSFAEAGAGPLVLITAYGALFSRGGLQAGHSVLIHAGAGGVGHVAVQMAKIAGATVITTVSDEAKSTWLKSLGADHTIRYQDEDVVEKTLSLTGGRGADLVFDTVGAEVFNQSIKACAHFGSVVTLLDPGQFDLAEARMRNLKIGFELMLTPMLRELPEHRDQHIKILNQCSQWIDDGLLNIHVTQELPLHDAKRGHEMIEGGHTSGKIVLIP